MNVTIVGGSAPSTALLAAEIVDVELRIVGRNPEHVESVVRACTVLANDGVRVRGFAGDGALARALRGSHIVILQARYGGIAAREYDERFPLAFGIPGDEGLGPGGLASAWRSWPHLAGALDTISEHAADAFVVLMTAPLGILTIAGLQRYPWLKLAGLCELPYVTLADACARADVPLEDVRFSYAGVNHLGWFDDVRTPQGVQLAPLRLKYLRLHDRTDEVVAEQRSREPRARALAEFAREAYCCFSNGDETQIREVLALRPAPWYRFAVAPLIEAMKPNSSGDAMVFLTTTNDGYLEPFADDVVLERPFKIRQGRLQPMNRSGSASAETVDHVRRFTEFERLAANAVLNRSERDITRALRAHPWVSPRTNVEALGQAVTSLVAEAAIAR